MWGGWDLSRKPVSALSRVVEVYEMALIRYTHREVSNPSDVLKVFGGVVTVLSEGMGTSFWQGIPERILAVAICWRPRAEHTRRRLVSW